ncbi:MAG: hypothetical protein Q9160_000394 [Pyrenula sp. 1 TL-2023]
MMRDFPGNDGADTEDQKPGFWNPALRPDNDQALASEQPIDSTIDDIYKPFTNQDLGYSAAHAPSAVSGLDAAHYINADIQSPAVASSQLSLSLSRDGQNESVKTITTDHSSLRSMNDSPPGRSLHTSIHGLISQPPDPAPNVAAEMVGRVDFAAPGEKSTAEFTTNNEEAAQPPWLISRNQTDLGNLLEGVRRTSTFPEPSHGTEHINGDATMPLPSTQIESIIHDSSINSMPDLSSESHPITNDESDGKATSNDFSLVEGPARSDYAYMPDPDEEEARFEEGLPLVPTHTDSDSLQKDGVTHSDSLNDFFSPSAGDSNQDFFNRAPSQLAHNSSPLEHRTFGRKNTTDVLTTLGTEASGIGHDTDNDGVVEGEQQQDRHSPTEKTWMEIEGSTNGDSAGQWQAMLGEDNEFLVEDADDLLSDSEADSPPEFFDNPPKHENNLKPSQQIAEETTVFQPISQEQSSIKTSSNTYAPHQPSTSDLAQGMPGLTAENAGNSQSRFPATVFNSKNPNQQVRPQVVERTESFADQNKGGYKSPYDLPMDITKPRRRPQASRSAMLPASSKPPPPPRSSSIISNASASSMSSPPSTVPPNLGASIGYRPQSAGVNKGLASSLEPHQPSQKSPQSSSSFFEELPTSTKPRPSAIQGRYTPQTSGLPKAPPSASPSRPNPPPKAHSAIHTPSQTTSADPYAHFQLQKPTRLDPFSNVPLQATHESIPASSQYPSSITSQQNVPRPTVPSRYSPAPPAASTNAPPRNRYVSQPNATSMPPPPSSLPFQPRTSSPLAHHEQSQLQQQAISTGNTTGTPSAGLPPVGSDALSGGFAPHISRLGSVGEGETFDPIVSSAKASLPNASHVTLDHDQSRSAYPQSASQGFLPPKRSQSSSPGRRDARLSQYALPDIHSIPRPVSAHGQTSPVKSNNQSIDLPVRPPVQQRGLSQNISFIPPQDDQQSDELQRWRGSPIFRFGFGGSIVSSFPKHIPRYVVGQATPMIKPSGGSVKIESARGILSFVEIFSRFPGPLRSKAKKKDLLTWLSERIASFQYDFPRRSEAQELPDPRKRHEEKVILWKLVKVIVEFDGIIEGKPDALKAVGSIVSPELEAQEKMSEAVYGPGSNLTGIYQPVGTLHQPLPLDPSALESVRQNLLRGDREKAVWDAVDAGLWAHAMLISSTLDKQIWRQVVQEFVRQEVKTAGNNTESLAALYEIFAGNLDESVDELVPPSARAGLQMVSKVSSAGPTKNALDGLDRWRETLTLVLNNRSSNDHQALATLGRLLASYGRIEAAHSCFLFSKALNLPSIFGAFDDPHTSVVLLGADHRHGADISFDEDAILLTEAYEFATTLLPNNAAASTAIPHLQAFKLQHALMLAEYGFKSEAQQYCDAIAGSLKATTKSSPYYHVQFLAQLDDLTKRLQQAPIDGSSSWISKPSMEKVSGSMWNKFSNFIAGDESDAASTGSGKDVNHDFGPFAKMSSTPTISRAPSVSDLQGSYPLASGTAPPNGAASRYAPSTQYASNNQYVPRSSLDLQGGRASLDSQRSPTYLAGQLQGSPSFDSGAFMQPTHQQPYTPSPYQPTSQPTSQPSSQARYQATPPQSSYTPSQKMDGLQQHPYSSGSYMPTPPLEQLPSQSQSSSPATSYPFEPVPQTEGNLGLQAQNPSQSGEDLHSTNVPTQDFVTNSTPSSHEQQSFSSYGGYDQHVPQSYTPYIPEPDSPDSPARSPPKFQPTPSATSIVPEDPSSASSRNQRDREVDDAFRKAAEADAARDKKPGPGDKTVKPKSSWFGSWFKGNDDDLNKSSDPAPGGKVIRAKLGEESSFYYDPDLKKWVNRKDPNSATTSARATPPPPKAAPSRSVSGLGPPAPPSSRLASSPSMPILNASGPPLGRPETPASRNGSPAGEAALPLTAGDTVGLAAPPLAPVSRPSSTMSSASNIDDLLGGPPQARKAGGTVKGKKKGRGYVDVMAK